MNRTQIIILTAVVVACIGTWMLDGKEGLAVALILAAIFGGVAIATIDDDNKL